MKKDNQPELSEYQRIYIRMIAKEVGDEVEAKIKPDIDDMQRRIIRVERKIFNGFGTKINLLFAFYGLFIALLVKLAFFH